MKPGIKYSSLKKKQELTVYLKVLDLKLPYPALNIHFFDTLDFRE